MNVSKKEIVDRRIDVELFKILLATTFALSLIVFGFILDSPVNIFYGLIKIIKEPDILITDYFKIAGAGAAFVNSGLLTLIFIIILWRLKIHFYGVTFAALCLIAGFSLFGKNLFNVWFIILGVYLFSVIQKQKFTKYIYIALFGTAMSPMVSQIMFDQSMNIYLRIPLGAFIGIFIGILLPPLSMHLLKIHQGYNLYNVGFTGGLIGTIIVSILHSYGYTPKTRLEWSQGNNTVFLIYLLLLFSSMIIIGFIYNNKSIKNYIKIIRYSGRLVSDFVLVEGIGITLINMGIVGTIATSYILLINGDLNGPTIGGIFTIVGFGAFGKHPRNIIPIFIGVFIGSLSKIWGINDPSIQLAALFGTALAPIAGEFGWKYGVIAGFIHSSVVLHVVSLHGGLNLYNNGFSAGIVAAALVPMIEALRKD